MHGYTTRNTFLYSVLGLPPSIQLLIQITKADNETALKKVTRKNRNFQRRGQQRERQIKNRFYKQNNNFACAPRFFCTFLFPFLHDHNVKMPNFAFCGGRNKRRRNSVSLSLLGYGPQEINSRRARQHLTKKVGRNNCDKD